MRQLRGGTVLDIADEVALLVGNPRVLPLATRLDRLRDAMVEEVISREVR